MVLQARPTPTQFPTNTHQTAMERIAISVLRMFTLVLTTGTYNYIRRSK